MRRLSWIASCGFFIRLSFDIFITPNFMLPSPGLYSAGLCYLSFRSLEKAKTAYPNVCLTFPNQSHQIPQKHSPIYSDSQKALRSSIILTSLILSDSQGLHHQSLASVDRNRIVMSIIYWLFCSNTRDTNLAGRQLTKLAVERRRMHIYEMLCLFSEFRRL